MEQSLHPALRGRPVVTGKERGIIACASYEAKALGVKRGISLCYRQADHPGAIYGLAMRAPQEGDRGERSQPCWRRKNLLPGETARRRIRIPLLDIVV